MTDLVLLHHNEPMTTSLAIAEGTENSHEAVIKLVRKYVDDLQEFGTFGFEIQKSGGRPTEVAFLNEPQATLLITYMRNNDIVRRFKIALVKAFYELRAQVAVPPAPTFAPMDHGADVLVSADRTFRAMLRTCRAAGLRLPQALGRANAVTLHRTGVDVLAEIDVQPEDGGSCPDDDLEARLSAWLETAPATFSVREIVAALFGIRVGAPGYRPAATRLGTMLMRRGYRHRRLFSDGRIQIYERTG